MRPDKTGRLVILNRPSGVILKIVPPGVHSRTASCRSAVRVSVSAPLDQRNRKLALLTNVRRIAGEREQTGDGGSRGWRESRHGQRQSSDESSSERPERVHESPQEAAVVVTGRGSRGVYARSKICQKCGISPIRLMRQIARFHGQFAI